MQDQSVSSICAVFGGKNSNETCTSRGNGAATESCRGYLAEVFISWIGCRAGPPKLPDSFRLLAHERNSARTAAGCAFGLRYAIVFLLPCSGRCHDASAMP